MTVNNDSITQAEIDDGLTEEERRALADTDDDTTNDKTGADDADDQDEKDDDESDGAGDTGDDSVDGTADDADDTGAAGRDDGTTDDAGAEQPEEPAQQAAPVFVAEAPADAEAKLSELRTQKADLRAQYNDGDITFDEYEDQKDALIEQEGEIKRAVERSQLAADMETQRQKNQWDNDCNAFMGAHPEYADREGEPFKQINEAVIALANMPSNKGLSGPEILEKAHKVVLATSGTSVVGKKADDGKKAGVTYKKPEQPVNLSKVPAAAQNDTGEGRFSAIDKLEGMAYEEALSKMSEAERDAYLASH